LPINIGMSNICRNKDLGRTGHGCTGVIGVKATARSVFVNGIPVARLGDRTFPHLIRRGLLCVGHIGKVNRASNSVFAEGIGVARVGDSYDRGAMIQGSENVFAGG